MLIIPIEQKLDGSNPPVATLLLILINCFVFFGYQSNDESVWQEAIEVYQSQALYFYEHRIYSEYLAEKSPDLYQEFKQFDEAKASYWMLSDKAFAHYLEYDYFINNVTALKWMDGRKEVNGIVAKLSHNEYGFTPGQFSIVGLFAAMFLHGDLAHILGNMLFLFIYGFSLEISLGRLWFLGIYLLSGLSGNLLTWAVSPDSLIPVVGASGAIFGLLGMYLGLYGFSKIKFFFTIGFYVNYFSAPALVLLPYWGLIELYDHFTANDNVAHFVHLGGLISGALVVALAKDRVIHINRDYVDKVNDVDPFKEEYDRFLRLLENLDITRAKKLLAELLQKYPKHFQLWKHQFDLWKLKPVSPNFDLAAKALFSQKNLSDPEAETVSLLADEYDRLSSNKSAFTLETRSNLFQLLMHLDKAADAESHLLQLLDEPTLQNNMPNMILMLANKLSARNHHAKAREYAEMIIQRFPHSEAARQAQLIASS